MSCSVSSLPQAASKVSVAYFPSRSTLYTGNERREAETPTTAGLLTSVKMSITASASAAPEAAWRWEDMYLIARERVVFMRFPPFLRHSSPAGARRGPMVDDMTALPSVCLKTNGCQAPYWGSIIEPASRRV